MGDHDAVESVITMAPIPVITIAWRMHLANLAAPLVNEVLVVLRPERWWSVDFSRMGLG